MSVARFVADQRTNYRVPHTLTCLLLGVSLSWFYKWRDRSPTPRQQRRAELDAAVKAMFAELFGPTDTRMYRIAQQVLKGEHRWLEEGIVGIDAVAAAEEAEEARPAADHIVVGPLDYEEAASR